jgi:hypothetical protein
VSALLEKATGEKPTIVKASCLDFEVWVDDKLVVSKKELKRLPLLNEAVEMVKKEMRL